MVIRVWALRMAMRIMLPGRVPGPAEALTEVRKIENG